MLRQITSTMLLRCGVWVCRREHSTSALGGMTAKKRNVAIGASPRKDNSIRSTQIGGPKWGRTVNSLIGCATDGDALDSDRGRFTADFDFFTTCVILKVNLGFLTVFRKNAPNRSFSRREAASIKYVNNVLDMLPCTESVQQPAGCFRCPILISTKNARNERFLHAGIVGEFPLGPIQFSQLANYDLA